MNVLAANRVVLIVPVDTLIPKSSAGWNASAAQRIVCDKYSVEYVSVEAYVLESLPAALIESVERIENMQMFDQFDSHRQTMKKQQRNVNMKMLFHGTTADSVDNICDHNFDRNYRGRNATLYGQGK